MEAINYGDDVFDIPSGLCDDFSYLLEIISPDTWNNILTDEHREMLMKYLPDFPKDDLNEKTHTLEMFFMNENFLFGSPLQKFFVNLKKGFYNPDVAKLRKIHRKILYKSYKYRQKKYCHKLLEEILVKRKDMLEDVKERGFDQDQNYLYDQNNSLVLSRKEMCIQRARKRYYKEIRAVKAEAGCDSDLSDDDYSEGIGLSLNKKQRRQLFLLEASFPSNLCLVRSTHTKGSLSLDLEANLTSARNPFDSSEEHYRNLMALHLANHKKRKLSFDTRGITLKSILERTEMLTKKPLQRPTPIVSSPVMSSRPVAMPVPIHTIKRSPSKKKAKPACNNYTLIPIENLKKELSSDSLSSDGETTQDIDVTKDSYCASPASSTVDDVKLSIKAELTQETHLSFFSLLRDIFCSTMNQRMGKPQLQSSISTWQDSAISPLNEWFCLCDSWVQVLPSTVNFLCGNTSSEYLLPDFVPFIEFKNTLKYFQWIGAGRDSDANLEPLCQYWLSNRDNISSDWPKDVILSSDSEDIKPQLPPTPAKGVKNWNPKRLHEGDTLENIEYHAQERNRYGQPHKAFTYRMKGYESVIGPVKGVYTQQQTGNTTKARGHLLLVPDRPPYVTILSLVWDAVARLPNSEGTKLDICELLKESQFLVPINNPSLENTLNNVVSGALDRLQNEKDPCVKFDTSRKLWVYLHKSRSEKELEMMHQLKLRSGSSKNKSQSSRKVKKKEDATLNQGPPNVALEQYSPAIKQMDGSEIRIKDEDILKNWVKIASSKTKKKENKISQAQLKQELNKMKKLNLATLESPVLVCTSESLPTEFVTQTIMQSTCITDEPKVVVSGEVSPQKICSSVQFSKVSNSLLQSNPSTSTTTALSPGDAVKLQLQAQSRKYQSSSEKKKSVKQEGIASSPKSSTCTTTIATPTKIYHTQPVMTSAVVTQPKGIKLVQYSNPNIQAKGVVGNASIMVDTASMPAALVGQKLVVAGNRLLVQGGKVLHNVAAANVTGRTKQVLASVLPARHIMAVSNVKKQTSDQLALEGGRYIQIATVDASAGYQKQTGYQKLTLVPQYSQATLAAAGGQKLQEAATVGTLAKGTITAGELKLKLGSTAFATAAGNIISLGGKQILLTTKGSPNNRTAQIHQIVLPVSTSGQQATVVSTTNAGTVTATTSGGTVVHQSRIGIGGQQIVVPASALAGSSLNLKRLQAFQSFKVVPAAQLSQQQQQQQRGKPVVAHILAPASTTTASGVVPTTKLALQVATSTATILEKSNTM